MYTRRYARVRHPSQVTVNAEKLSSSRYPLLLSHWTLRIAILIVGLLSPEMTAATVIVPVSETELAQQATAIIIGTVSNIESYWDTEAGQTFTHITVTPQEVLKGTLATGNLTLKQYGGSVGNRRMWIDGSPAFIRGEKVLLFLDTNPDGSACVAQLYLGKFSLFTDRDTGKEIAYRGDTPIGVHILTKTSTSNRIATSASEEFHEVATLKERIHVALTKSSTSSSSTTASFSGPIVPLNSTVEQQERFVLVRPLPIRWFEPDSGDPVIMSINPANAFAGAEDRIDTGFQTWSSVRDSTFRFRKGNETNSEGFRADGVSAISFSDPLNQLPNPVRCTGVLAATAHTALSDKSLVLHEQTFFRITEADLVFADGWESCPEFQNPTNLDEIATHELGHVLGLGHSPNPDSIMFASAHFDGRGSSLAQEDKDGVAFLYPDASFPPCNYTISISKRSVGGGASTGKVNVTTSNRCGWTAFSNVAWISVIEGESSSGNGTVTYSIAANTSKQARQGTLFIAGHPLILTQKGGSSSTPRTPRKRVPPFARG